MNAMDGLTGNLAALQSMSIKALKSSMDAMEMAATIVTEDAPTANVSPEHLGQNIDISA